MPAWSPRRRAYTLGLLASNVFPSHREAGTPITRWVASLRARQRRSQLFADGLHRRQLGLRDCARRHTQALSGYTLRDPLRLAPARDIGTHGDVVVGRAVPYKLPISARRIH